jgi:hypothetical protein
VEGAEHVGGELPLDVADLILFERTELTVASTAVNACASLVTSNSTASTRSE